MEHQQIRRVKGDQFIKIQGKSLATPVFTCSSISWAIYPCICMLFHQLSYLPLYLHAVPSAELSTPVFTCCSIIWAIYHCIYMLFHQLSYLPLYSHAVPSAELSTPVFTCCSISWAVCQHFLNVSKFHQKFRGLSSIYLTPLGCHKKGLRDLDISDD
jgi:hypothetical protein